MKLVLILRDQIVKLSDPTASHLAIRISRGRVWQSDNLPWANFPQFVEFPSHRHRHILTCRAEEHPFANNNRSMILNHVDIRRTPGHHTDF